MIIVRSLTRGPDETEYSVHHLIIHCNMPPVGAANFGFSEPYSAAHSGSRLDQVELETVHVV